MATENTGDGIPTVEKLTERIDDLNKGIAKYREDAITYGKVSEEAKREATEAKVEVERLKKVIEEATDSEDKTDKVPKLNDGDQKRLEAWAKEQGFVTKKEVDEEKARMFNESIRSVESQAIEEFLKSHPEYDNAELWETITKEFSQYRQPTSITGYRQILAKIHKELRNMDDADSRARVEAETRKRLGLGGGPTGGSEYDTTMEDLMEKYPNISREAIESRLEEINKITSARLAKNKQKQK